MVLSFRDRKEETMKKKNELPAIGKDEMNLVEFPITLLAKRHESECKTMKFSDTIMGEDNKPIKREWVVTGSDEFGLPLAQDNDLLVALLLLGKEKNFASPAIYFSRYKLLEIMGMDTRSGSNYDRCEDMFNRMCGVRIYAKNAFWDNVYKQYVTVNIGIFDEYHLFEGNPKKNKLTQEPLPLSHVRLNHTLYESIKAGYIKSLNADIYFKLSSVITKRLYRYLDKKSFGGKKKFEINLYTLAYVHMGFSDESYKYSSEIKRKLSQAHEELIEAGFLKSAEYKKTSDGSSEKVVYCFVHQQEQNAKDDAIETNASESLPPDPVLLEKLIHIGVTRKVAEQILREYPLEAVKTQVEALPHRKAEDAPAALVSSIMNDWALPASYKKRMLNQEQVRTEQRQAEQEERQKREHRARIGGYLSSLAAKELDELTRQAREIARREGGAIFKDKEIPDYMVTGYVHMVVEKRLEKSKAKMVAAARA